MPHVLTYSYRIKDATAGKHLVHHARAVNFVWNFCKATQIEALHRKSAKVVFSKKAGKEIAIANWLERADFHALTKGTSRELKLHSQTIQAIYEEYITRCRQFRKLLRWRGKKSLGWVPFKASGVKLGEGTIAYQGQTYRLWWSRSLPEGATITNGSFSQDSRGRWYVNVTFRVETLPQGAGGAEVGVDLGIKQLGTCSDGSLIPRPALREAYLARLRGLEQTRKYARRQQARAKKFGRLPKAKRFSGLNAKVANRRKDHLHKEARKLVDRSAAIVVGDLSCAFMNRNRKLSGVSLDNGIGKFKEILHYKAVGAGVAIKMISERDSTQTCSGCGWQHPRSNRIGLGVREWSCPSCHSHHDRDVNAARNILRMGRHALTQPCASEDLGNPPAKKVKARK